MNEKKILACYRALRRWVEREQRRQARTRARKSQTYLRRSRLVDDVDPVRLRELLRELRAFAKNRAAPAPPRS